MRINTDGQITIPPDIREQLGLLPGTEVQLEVIDDTVQIRRRSPLNRGVQLVAAIRGKATRSLRTDEIMQLTRQDP
ncbi:AbrB/MazE/SpoVT family DNA-binding domain-containing protein [Brasilonema sp. CT11]|nr:AbrB/MazE/SpoVT family DNA-binding domain-containing protein [Brasilonema sp. CT11]